LNQRVERNKESRDRRSNSGWAFWICAGRCICHKIHAASKERCALSEDARGGAIAESQSHEYGTHPTRCAE
jgi:hypothetical protein